MSHATKDRIFSYTGFFYATTFQLHKNKQTLASFSFLARYEGRPKGLKSKAVHRGMYICTDAVQAFYLPFTNTSVS